MGIFKKFFSWLTNENVRENITIPLDAELIRKNKIIKAQQQQNQGLKAQIAKYRAEENAIGREDKSEEFKDKLAEKLNERAKEIKFKDYENSFHLRKLYYALFKYKNFADQIEVTDYEDKITFGIFKDFVFLPNGYFGVIIKGDVLVVVGRMLHQVIWKPDSLHNYLKRKRLPLAVDGDMNPVKDMENEEIPDIMWDENSEVTDENGNPMLDEQGNHIKGQYVESEELTDTSKNLLMKREERIREANRTIERLERFCSEQSHKIEKLSRNVRFLENERQNRQSELSAVTDSSLEYAAKIGDMQRQTTQLTQLKALNESLIDKYEITMKSLMEKIERVGDKTVRELLKAEMEESIKFLETKLKPIIMPEKEEKLITIAQPGQLMPSRR